MKIFKVAIWNHNFSAGVDCHHFPCDDKWRLDLSSQVSLIFVVKGIAFKVVDELLPDVFVKGLRTMGNKGL